jgi:ketosteroid isomerase-like protein
MGAHERSTRPEGDDVRDLIKRAEESASAWMRGDLGRYLALTEHAPGFTLLAPIGGAPTKHENRGEELATSTSNFQGGDATLEHVETHAWGDTVVLVMIERQHGQVSDLPDQDWSLRVTHVYRRDGSDWLLVHRHADPLVKTIDLGALSALTDR